MSGHKGDLSPEQEDTLEKVRTTCSWRLSLRFLIDPIVEECCVGRGAVGGEGRPLLLAVAESAQIRLGQGRRHAQEGE